MKLDNPVTTIEIGGEPVRVGKLTIGAACEIEAYLETLETPLEKIEKSKILTQIDKDAATGIVESALQDLAFWPPDAIGALSDSKWLQKAGFSKTFCAAVVRSYNPHFTDADVTRITDKLTWDIPYILRVLSLPELFPKKEEPVPDVATPDRPNESNGGESSPS